MEEDMTHDEKAREIAWIVEWTEKGMPCHRIFDNYAAALEWAAYLPTHGNPISNGAVKPLVYAKLKLN
jgi:hypothetical protein